MSHQNPFPGQPGPYYGAPLGYYQPPPPPRKPKWQKTKIVVGVIVGLTVLGGIIDVFDGPDETRVTAIADTPEVEPVATSPSPTPTPTATPTPTPTVTPKPKPVTYKSLTTRQWRLIAKDPDAHIGEAYIVYGYVTQADAATGSDILRASVDGPRHKGEYGYLDYDTNVVLAEGAASFDKVVQDDIFSAKVIMAKSIEYDTQIGGSTTAPVLRVDSLKVIGSAN